MQSLKLIHIIRVAFFFTSWTCKNNYRCPCTLSGLKQRVFWSNYGQPGPSGISWGRFQFRILQLRYKPKPPFSYSLNPCEVANIHFLKKNSVHFLVFVHLVLVFTSHPFCAKLRTSFLESPRRVFDWSQSNSDFQDPEGYFDLEGPVDGLRFAKNMLPVYGC